MHVRAAILGLCLAISPAWADPRKAAQLRDAAAHDDTAWQVVESLITEIGHRPAGTPAAARARDWGVTKLTALGFTNVHVEPFAKRARLRDAEAGEITGPYPQKLALLGLGNSVPTPPEGITAEVVVIDSLAALKAAPKSCCTGKIVLVNQPMIRTQSIYGYFTAVQARSAAPKASAHGAVASLVRSISTNTARAPHAGAMQPTKSEARPIPAAALGVPDAGLIEHMAARGPVTVHLLLRSHVSDTTAWTVLGEMPASDPGAGVIVIGGHLDSWDPGTGAIDDAAGIVIAEESDLGADFVDGAQLPAGAWAASDIAPLEGVLAPLKVMALPMPPEEAGSDVEAIQGEGVPVFALNQDASRYFNYHHSQDDTMAIIDPAQLRQKVVAWATTLSILADTSVGFRKVKK